MKGDLAEAEVFGSTIGDKPDRFRLREPSARDEGPMLAAVVTELWILGGILPVYVIHLFFEATTRSASIVSD